MISLLFLEETLPSRASHQDFGQRLGKRLIQSLHRRPKEGDINQADANAILDMVETVQPQSAYKNEQKSTDAHISNPDPESNDAMPATQDQGKVYTTQVMLQILSVSLLAFLKVASHINIPVFLASPSDSTPNPSSQSSIHSGSGFGITTRTIGPILLAQACVAVAGQLLLVPRIVNAYGPLRVYRYSLWLYALTYVLTPFTVRLRKPESVVATSFDLLVKVLLSSTGYTCSAILYA
jgi:hypothetical protein